MIVVEHDLAVLDYLSDYICVLYGTPGAYGVVTMPFSVLVCVCVREREKEENNELQCVQVCVAVCASLCCSVWILCLITFVCLTARLVSTVS